MSFGIAFQLESKTKEEALVVYVIFSRAYVAITRGIFCFCSLLRQIFWIQLSWKIVKIENRENLGALKENLTVDSQ